MKRQLRSYDPASWFDETCYATGVSDHNTVWPGADNLPVRYHYTSVELLILRHFVKRRVDIRGLKVFDIGSGAGHWIEFYRSMGAKQCVGIDISPISARHLEEKYRGDDRVQVHHGLFQEFLDNDATKYDIINAIGVMFHVVDDDEWLRGLTAVSTSLEEGGCLVVGGHFGLIDGVNVQFDNRNLANKRLRSARRWRTALRRLGFGDIHIYHNRAYLFVDQILPENNVLIASKHTTQGQRDSD